MGITQSKRCRAAAPRLRALKKKRRMPSCGTPTALTPSAMHGTPSPPQRSGETTSVRISSLIPGADSDLSGALFSGGAPLPESSRWYVLRKRFIYVHGTDRCGRQSVAALVGLGRRAQSALRGRSAAGTFGRPLIFFCFLLQDFRTAEPMPIRSALPTVKTTIDWGTVDGQGLYSTEPTSHLEVHNITYRVPCQLC